MPGSASSCTSEYRNRPVSRARSSLAFLSASSAVVTLVPSLVPAVAGSPTVPAGSPPGQGGTHVEPTGQDRHGRINANTGKEERRRQKGTGGDRRRQLPARPGGRRRAARRRDRSRR